MAKILTDDEVIFARRCYINGVAGPSMARKLSISAIEADTLFDRFRKQGLRRNGRAQEMPVTLPRLRYLEGAR